MSPARETAMVPRAEPRSYYGRPVVKPPVWSPEVPWYFFTGGIRAARPRSRWPLSGTGTSGLPGARAWSRCAPPR